MLGMLRVVFMIGLVLFGATGAFVGAVMLFSALVSGTVSYSYVVDGRLVASTVSRLADPSSFWRLTALFGLLPSVLGAILAWYGMRRLRS